MNNCEWAKDRIDLRMDGELGSEAAQMERHLENCAECGETLVMRQALRSRVRGAADAAPVPADLATRVRVRLDGRSHGLGWNRSLMAIAATLVLAAGVGYFSLRHPVEPENAMWSRVSAGEVPIMKVGLQDHVHCALFQKFPQEGTSFAVMAANLGHDYADLVRVMQQYAPAGMKVIEAHKCHVNGRAYVHVIARDGARTLSLVITRRGSSEALESEVKAVASEAATPIYSAQASELGIAAFETSRHLVYVVSNLEPAVNLAAMRSMTPALSDVLRRAES